MAIVFSTCVERDLVYARWSGVISQSEFRDSYAAYLGNASHRSGRPELLDLSRVEDIEIDYRKAQAMLRFVNLQGRGRVARTQTVVLAPHDSIFALVRMVQQLAELADGIRVELYRAETEALRAVGLDMYDGIDAMLAAERFEPPIMPEPMAQVPVTAQRA